MCHGIFRLYYPSGYTIYNILTHGYIYKNVVKIGGNENNV